MDSYSLMENLPGDEFVTAKVIMRAIMDEREACARIAEADIDGIPGHRFDGGSSAAAALRIATAIRARGGK